MNQPKCSKRNCNETAVFRIGNLSKAKVLCERHYRELLIKRVMKGADIMIEESKERKVQNWRVENGRCVDCGTFLTEKDKEFDKEPIRKSCMRCLKTKLYRISKATEQIEEVKENPFEKRGDKEYWII